MPASRAFRRLLAVAAVCLLAVAAWLVLAPSRGERGPDLVAPAPRPALPGPVPGAPETPPVAPTGRALWVDAADPACSDDRSPGDRQRRPFCSVGGAAEVARPGETVHIAAGRYTGTVRPRHTGSPEAPIRFVADEPGVVLDAGGAANAVRIAGTSHVRFTGMTITGGLNQGVWVERADGVVLAGVRVRGNRGAGVQLKSGTGTRISSSELTDNGRTGLLELAGARDTRLMDSLIARNGRDGVAYNGDGVQLGGSGAEVARSRIEANGDSPFEHGVYTSAASTGWRLRDNTLTANAGANVKAAGVGTISGNRILDARWGIVLSDNPERVAVTQNLIGGPAQHLVFLTAGATAARATLTHNTIVQSGRSTGSGEASALFVLVADDLELHNNLIAYTGADAAGVSVWINDAGRLGRLVSDTNWWAANDAQSRHVAYDGRRMTLADWRTRAGQDARSVTSWSPAFDETLRVQSDNWGAGRGRNLRIPADFCGAARPSAGAVDIGAHQGRGPGC